MPTLTSSGKSDQEYVAELRDELRDYPFPLAESFVGNGIATYTRLQRFPIWDNDPYLTVSGVTLRATRAELTGGDAAIDYDNGYVYFGTAPGAGTTVTVTKQVCRWTDRTMLRKLYDGLRMMFPKVWQRGVTNGTFAVNKWEYNLPFPDFQDPRTKVFRVEGQEIPAATERFHTLRAWVRTGPNTILLPNSQSFSPGAAWRVHYAGPYRSLSDLEPQLTHLPKMYAKAQLLYDAEAKRTSYQAVSATSEEQLNPPGANAQIAGAMLAEFYRALADLERPIPMAAPATSYAR